MWTMLWLLAAPMAGAQEADDEDAGDVPALAGDEKAADIAEEELGAGPPSPETIQAYLEAEGMPPEEAARVAMMRIKQMALVEAMTFQDGDVELAEGLATLTVPEGFHYLSPEHTSLLLEAWGNPPDPELLGALLPADLDNLFSAASWVVILDYEPMGYVTVQAGAEGAPPTLDADALLTVMQAGVAASGAPPLVGWAEPPRYNPASHTLSWGRELIFDAADHTVNYDVRVLGRAGALTMRAVLSADRFDELRPRLLALADAAVFSDGYRYEQYVEDRDPRSPLSLDAIVAGPYAGLLPQEAPPSPGIPRWVWLLGVALIAAVSAMLLIARGDRGGEKR